MIEPTFLNWFLSPAMLGWLALATIPIIIHLLFRRRVKPLPWAAMQFLENAHKKTKRRIQLENVLLLLMRMLAIALLVAAVARPFLTADNPIANIAHAQRHVAVVLDVSGSMGFGDGGLAPPFERARTAAQTILKQLDPGGGDTAVIIPHASPAEASGATQASGYLDAEQLDRFLSNVTVSPRTTDIADALTHAKRALQTYKTGKEVYLLTDLQRIGFGKPTAADEKADATTASNAGGTRPPQNAGNPAERQASTFNGVREALARLTDDGTIFRVVDVGPGQRHPENCGIVSLETPPRVTTTAQSAVVIARVKNFGPTEARVGVKFLVGNDDTPRRAAPAKRIPPGGTESFLFRNFRFREDGPARVRALLDPPDAFSLDDERDLVLDVNRRIRVLLVNGDTRATDPFTNATDYLDTALNPFARESDEQGPFDPEEIAWHDLPRVDLSKYDVVVLADTAIPGDREVDALVAFVRSGGGLLFTWGPNMRDTVLAKERLFDRAGLLPIVPIREEGTADWNDPKGARYRFVLGERHPVTAPFHDNDVLRSLLGERVKVSRFMHSAAFKKADEAARVLMRFDDQDESPALVERTVGAGKVIALMTSANRRWTNLPDEPVFLPLIHGIMNHLLVPAEDPSNLMIGSPLVRIYTKFPGKRALARPSGGSEVLTPARIDETSDFPRFKVESERLMERGVYALDRASSTGPGNAERELFAVNPDPIEGDLRRLRVEDLRTEVFPGMPIETPAVTALEEDAGDTSRGGELWKVLVAAALALLVIESWFAQRIGARQEERIRS